MVAPLDGLRVLDLAQGLAGPFCAKLLADQGADVVKIEPLGGDLARSFGPFPSDKPDPEASGSFVFVNTSKRGVTLDLDSSEGRADLQRLLGRYDVVIAGETEPQLAARGLGLSQLRAWNPNLILTTVNGFGSAGPYAGQSWNNLIACALGGWANACGIPQREPLQIGGAIAEMFAGGFAAVATLLAVAGRRNHGRGDHVDVSAQQTTLTGALVPSVRYEYDGALPERQSTQHSGPSFILPSADGHAGINVLTQAQWELLCQFLGRPDMVDDPRFQPGVRAAHADEVAAEFAPIVAQRDAEEMFHEAQIWRVPLGIVPSLREIPNMPPHRDRGFFVPIEVSGRTIEVPGLPFTSNATTPTVSRPPRLGEHTAEVLAEVAGEPVLAPPDAPPPSTNPPPLAGLRIVDLSMFMSGPLATQICADAGAEVIKVESVQRIDGWRGAGQGEQAWERSPVFNWINRSKHGITLNLTDERGSDLLKRLVADADVVIENYTPRVMANFGLDYEALRVIKPDLIMMSMPGFGRTGAWHDYVAFGLSTEQMAGICHLTGYADDQPLFTGTMGGDHLVGVMAAGALLGALHHRDQTGEGQHIDLGQVAASTMYVGDALTGWALSGRDPGRVGNRHCAMAPHGTYPCRDGRWIAIACEDSEQWASLAELIGHQEWTEPDSPYDEPAARLRDADLLDAAVTEWTRSQSHVELMGLLRSRGVMAAAVLNGAELLADPQLAARDAFIPQDRPGLGVKHYPGQPYQFLAAEPVTSRRAPMLGEDTREVLSRLLGLELDELEALEQDDVIGTLPIAARPD